MDVFVVPDEVIRIGSLMGILLLLVLTLRIAHAQWSSVMNNIKQLRGVHRTSFLICLGYAGIGMTAGIAEILKGSANQVDLGRVCIGFAAYIASIAIGLIALTGRAKLTAEILANVHWITSLLLLPFAWGHAGMGGEEVMRHWIYRLPLFCALNVILPVAVARMVRRDRLAQNEKHAP